MKLESLHEKKDFKTRPRMATPSSRVTDWTQFKTTCPTCDEPIELEIHAEDLDEAMKIVRAFKHTCGKDLDISVNEDGAVSLEEAS